MGLHHVLIFSALAFVTCNAMNQQAGGSRVCPLPGPYKLTVHLVPRIKSDLGWLETTHEYYESVMGLNSSADNKSSIFELIIHQLIANPSKTFVWSDTSRLWRWWSSQKNKTLKKLTRNLVENGQLEIVGGGWSVFDEAVTHYQNTVDQFTWSFRRLHEMFGAKGRPRIGWQLDSFGHSQATASLMAQFGFDGHFIKNIHAVDKKNRFASKTAEFTWQGVFTTIVVDDIVLDNSHDAELETKVLSFLDRAREVGANYATKNIIWPIAMPQNTTNPASWFKAWDKVISEVNAYSADSGIVAKFSTPTCYTQAVHSANLTWPIEKGDFLPFASTPHSYWTGYYSSRPAFKRLDREANHALHVCKQMHVLGGLGETQNLNALREALGDFQRALNAAGKQRVIDDHVQSLRKAMAGCDQMVYTALKKLVKGDELKFTKCPLLNISSCAVTENSDSYVVTVYNPLAWNSTKIFRLPRGRGEYEVVDLTTGAKLEIQTLPIPTRILVAPGRKSNASEELIFEAAGIPPLGFKSFHVQRVSKIKDFFKKPMEIGNRFEISNEFLTVKLDPISGFLSSVKLDGNETTLMQALFFYQSGKEVNNLTSPAESLPASGALIFRPESTTPEKIYDGEFAVYTAAQKGPLVQVINQTFAPWASQVFRVYKGQKFVEMEWLVGPIPTEDGVGKEVFSWFSVEQNYKNDTFLTDANGRESIRRHIDFRPGWNASILEPVAGNYYPITSSVAMHQKKSKVAVLVDRAHGVGSIFKSTFEIMLHRRLTEHDGCGVDEVLNETRNGKGLVVGGRQILIIGANVRSRQKQIFLREIMHEPVLFFTETNLSPEQWKLNYRNMFSALNFELPANVHLLTMEPWKDGTILLRLEHILEEDDHQELSKPAAVDLQLLFRAFSIVSATEMTLGADQVLENAPRFDFNSKKKNHRYLDHEKINPDALKIVLHPMQIRTFILKISLIKN